MVTECQTLQVCNGNAFLGRPSHTWLDELVNAIGISADVLRRGIGVGGQVYDSELVPLTDDYDADGVTELLQKSYSWIASNYHRAHLLIGCRDLSSSDNTDSCLCSSRTAVMLYTSQHGYRTHNLHTSDLKRSITLNTARYLLDTKCVNVRPKAAANRAVRWVYRVLDYIPAASGRQCNQNSIRNCWK